MRIAFAIMKLFPGGGLQRDCLELAREIREHGHDVVIFTSSMDAGDFADDLAVEVLPVRRRTNHGMQGEFASMLRSAASPRNFDSAVGFDKLPYLDVLYCADPSVRARMTREPYLFLLPRYRTYLAFERAVFAPAGGTKVLLLSQRQLNEYCNAWHTAPERLTLLPPTIAAARRRPDFRVNGVGARLRLSLGFAPEDRVWLAVAVAPFTKGLDRSLRALREFPAAKLVVAGLAPTSSRAAHIVSARARRLGVAGRIHWVGHREDIPELMAAADLLVHPARRDTTGTVILEAVVNGLPVITTAACGYAEHVEAAGGGIVIDEPFAFKAFLAALSAAEEAGRRARWSAAAARYGEQPLLYEGRSRAAEIILATAAERVHARAAAAAGKAKPADIAHLHAAGPPHQ
jgi:UDP-glucose:(heptosyl)LPS alpha-1,3-glucosyltransferase